MAVTHVESKMMNSSLYVPVNLKGYAYIMFGDLAVPIWGDYRGVNVTSQGALYDNWVEYFGQACHMDAFFGHCTALMEGDHMAKIVREVMDASMDYARSDNDVENESYDNPHEFIHEVFSDLEWFFWIAEHAVLFWVGGSVLFLATAFITYCYCCRGNKAYKRIP